MKTGEEQRAVRERMQAITDGDLGKLKPEAVVADAEDPDSPLHACFEWDNSIAGHRHRLEQARQLIRSVTVVITTETTTLRAPFYVRDPEAAKGEQGYVETAKLRDSVDLAREAVVEEFARVAQLLRRARIMAKALGIDGDVDRILDGVMDLSARVRVGSPAQPNA